ncbi:MAG: transposase [Bacteroidota bacterium]
MTGQSKRIKSHNRYPEELKRKIAKEYLSGKASYGVLAEEHGLKDKGVVQEFVKWYRRKGELFALNQAEMPTKKTTVATSAEPNTEEQIKELKRQLELSELKVEALETLIDLAEEQLKIDIRKKSGAKQSKK